MSAAPPRVLVVDDEPPIRKLLRMGLNAHGYDVLEAQNGKSALNLIRARNESVPIVVLSNRGDEAGKVQALDLGADDYVRNCWKCTAAGEQDSRSASCRD
jgi:two-component system, OmpR family, KDP operon response regulator KdpE